MMSESSSKSRKSWNGKCGPRSRICTAKGLPVDRQGPPVSANKEEMRESRLRLVEILSGIVDYILGWHTCKFCVTYLLTDPWTPEVSRNFLMWTSDQKV